MKCVFLLIPIFLATAGDANTHAVQKRAREAYWFESPAQSWTGAIPLGNGRLGAMIFGEVENETILLNETTIWEPPKKKPVNPNGAELIPQIRNLIFEGKRAEAEAMTESQFLQGRDGISSYQPLAFLRITHHGKGKTANYRRALALDEGVAAVTYTQNGTAFRRESFVAYEDGTACFRYTADAPGAISFTLKAERPGEVTTEAVAPGILRLTGNTGKGGVDFEMAVRVITRGGTLSTEEGGAITVTGADSAEFFVRAVTDYTITAPHSPRARGRASAAAADYAALKKRHTAAFSQRFTRTALDLGVAAETKIPLEQRLAQAKKKDMIDLDFLLLNYDFCRYLSIAASRKGGLPANLQGIWNPHMAAPWNSDWHLDINLSMFYWPAYTWNLAETTEPLVSLAEMAFRAAKNETQTMLGIQEGAFLTTSTDVWGYATPFRHALWGMYFDGGAWLLQDARQSGESKRIQPLLREQTLFYLNWIVRNPSTGKWVGGPGVSPENTYRLNGKSASVDMGTSHSQELIFATFRDFIAGASKEDPLAARVKAVMKELAMPGIGPDGALREWSQAFEEAEPGHRHLSHLYGMMPGDRITRRHTPELAGAVRKSMEKRIKAGYHAMGWSMGWMACLWARQGEGDRALAMLDTAPKHLIENLFTSAVGKPQVSDMHGFPAAVNEMLLQSREGEIEILPALPARMPEGSFRGFQARGGFLVDADWKNSALTYLKVTAQKDGSTTLITGEKETPITLKAGESYLFRS